MKARANVFLILSLPAALGWAAAGRDLPVNLTIDDYVKRAVEEGVKARQTAWALETAGYTREIAFRQTDSPTLSVGHTQSRSEKDMQGLPTLTPSKESVLTLNEQSPMGTAVTASGGYGDGGSAGSSSADAGKPSASASVSQPIYLFVKNSVRRTRRRADIAFANAKNTYDAGVLSIRSQARGLYYSVMQGEEAIKVAQRKVASSNKLLEVTQALVEAGKSAPVDSMRAKIVVQTDERALQNAVLQARKSALSAKNFIYAPLDKDVRFITQLEFAPLRAPLPRLVEYALLHQPNLEILRRARESAQLDLDAAVEPTRPTFTANGGYNYAEMPGTLTRGWNWSLSSNWMFFDSFVTRDQTRSARVAAWVTDLNLADAERTTRVNVENAYGDVKNAEKQIQDFTFSREQSVHNVDVVRLRFQNGLEKLIDVFDAENEMRDLDNEYLNLLVQFNTSKDQLSELVGVDVETLQ